MKNVTGLIWPSCSSAATGALGVITEVAFKVQAVPEAEATLVAERLA